MADVEGLTHTGPVALDLVESEEFYQRALGARLVNRNHFDSDNAPRGRSLHTVLTIADYMFTPMLPFDHVPMPPPEQRRGINNFRAAFAVSRQRFGEVLRYLHAAGVAFDGPVAHPEKSPIGESAYFQDPGGNFIEVCWRRDEDAPYHPTPLDEERPNDFRPATPPEGLVPIDAIAGIAVEVRDFNAAQAFYELIVADHNGMWTRTENRLVFQTSDQIIEFVKAAEPRTLDTTAQHYGIQVRRDRLDALVKDLTVAGFPIAWWREDHPAERRVAPYIQDPSGNRVQIVPVDQAERVIDHVGVEVFDMDPLEFFYTRILGGHVDYHFGRSVEHILEAKAAIDGRDPCAPWTRLTERRYTERKGGLPGPNQQLYVRYGPTRLLITLAKSHRQEPPEELLRGTPRVQLRVRGAAGLVIEELAKIGYPFQQDDQQLFLRDPAGNFLELVCGA